MMNIISIILFLAVIGFILWLINAYIPMQPIVKTIINFIVVIALILWLLSVIGVIPLHANFGNIC